MTDTAPSQNIFQCRENHLLCNGCFEKLGGIEANCPVCARTLRDKQRNRPLEKDRKIRQTAKSGAAASEAVEPKTNHCISSRLSALSLAKMPPQAGAAKVQGENGVTHKILSILNTQNQVWFTRSVQSKKRNKKKSKKKGKISINGAQQSEKYNVEAPAHDDGEEDSRQIQTGISSRTNLTCILRIMDSSSQNAGVLKHACEQLCNYAFNDERRRAIAEADGIMRIVDVSESKSESNLFTFTSDLDNYDKYTWSHTHTIRIHSYDRTYDRN